MHDQICQDDNALLDVELYQLQDHENGPRIHQSNEGSCCDNAK